MWNYLTTGGKKTFEDKAIQTIIQRKCSGDVSLKPDQEEQVFYKLLEYTPFRDIQEVSYKIIILPKPKQENLPPSISLNLENCLLIDDDAISELCLELRERIRKGLKQLKTYNDVGSQTDLHVQPHILEDEKVASVVADCAVQTVSINSCLMAKSKSKSK